MYFSKSPQIVVCMCKINWIRKDFLKRKLVLEEVSLKLIKYCLLVIFQIEIKVQSPHLKHMQIIFRPVM